MLPIGTHEQFRKGLVMVRTEFANALGKHGIQAVESVGRPFDPSVHEAVQLEDSSTFAPGIVIREHEKGYRCGDKLLRPARVIVAGPGSSDSGGHETLGLPPALLGELSVDEKAILVLLKENGSARASELSQLLRKNPGRLKGLMATLKRKLHAGGVVPFSDHTLPSGETLYRYQASHNGTET